MAQSGQICEGCGGAAYTVYSSFLSSDGAHQIQYIKCEKCGHRPDANKVVIPAEHIRRRVTLVRNRLVLRRRR